MVKGLVKEGKLRTMHVLLINFKYIPPIAKQIKEPIVSAHGRPAYNTIEYLMKVSQIPSIFSIFHPCVPFVESDELFNIINGVPVVTSLYMKGGCSDNLPELISRSVGHNVVIRVHLGYGYSNSNKNKYLIDVDRSLKVIEKYDIDVIEVRDLIKGEIHEHR
jgi:hypothetical protein